VGNIKNDNYMDLNERYDELRFENDDLIIANKIVENKKSVLLILSFILFLMFWISPFIPGRGGGNPLINQMPYFEALLWYLPFMLIPILIYYLLIRNVLIDSKNGLKTKMLTKIVRVKQSNSGLRIKVSNSQFIDKWIVIYGYNKNNLLKADDRIMISLMPKSRIALKYKIIEYKHTAHNK
jgi:hypothetical protein